MKVNPDLLAMGITNAQENLGNNVTGFRKDMIVEDKNKKPGIIEMEIVD